MPADGAAGTLAGMAFAAKHLPSEIADALARGALVVAANARAARALRRAYALSMQTGGAANWQAPAIHDWSAWLHELYRDLAGNAFRDDLPILLNPLQERHLWKSVQTDEAALVVSPDGMAALAAEAYALLSDYDAHADRRAAWADTHEDAEHFLRWADAFDARCEGIGVLAAARLASTLRMHAATLAAPPELLLIGFDRLLPAQSALLRALEHRGTIVVQESAGPPTASRELLCAADGDAEIYACAAWVRGLLEQSSECRIGVLVPQLNAVRSRLDRAFRRVLTPQAAMLPAGGPAPYEFSLGVPLAEVPAVHAALNLLQWLAGPLPAAAASSLLLSGFVAVDATEATQLAHADAALRRRRVLRTELELDRLLAGAAKLLPAGFRERAAAAHAWARREKNSRRAYGEWASAVESQLAAFGWPGFHAVDSAAFQALQRWSALLAEMATLGFASDRVSWAGFVRELQGAARRTLFAAESLDAPVQILGVAEASGQRFDAIWLLGAAENRWPAPGRLHPLLSPIVQRDHGMPHTTAALDLQLAQEQLARVLGSAPVVAASYPGQEDGSPMRPSPLLHAFGEARPVTAANPLAATPYRVERHAEPDRVRPWPLDRVAGGSDVLKRQSACGFQAFAVRRLGAEALEDERWGPDARERGGLLHAALEQLWCAEPVSPESGRLHTSVDLAHAVENGTLEEKVRAAIALALAATERETEDAWERGYLELEHERLATRLFCWLDEELKREPFSVQALEQRVNEAQVGPLRLNLRVDRVDTLADGRRLVLDYKTGAGVSTRQWLGERPEEPQLPIYARFGGLGDVAALAIAQVRAGKTRLHLLQEGAASANDTSHAVLDDETRAAWDRALLQLAEEFAQGDAPLHPRDVQKTCNLCGLFGVCRIRSQGDGLLLALHGDEGDDDA